MIPHHPYHIQIFLSVRFSRKIVFVTYLDRVVRIQIQHVSVFHIDSRNPVIGGGDEAGIVKAYVIGARADVLVPVQIAVAHSKMPFADRAGLIAVGLHHLRNSWHFRGDDQWSVPGKDLGTRVSPRICSGKESVSAWG